MSRLVDAGLDRDNDERHPQESCNLDPADALAIIGIAASPVSELRGAIPVAIAGFHFEWYHALPLAVLGNLLPVPFLLLFLDPASRMLSRFSFFEKIISRVFAMTRRRGKLIQRYERIGLVLFVAIPLPITGAWTGSLAAVLFGLSFRHAFISIVIGVLIAGAIVTAATLLGWTLLGGDSS